MTEPFNANSYIDVERKIRFDSGEFDPYERWVDEDGNVRLAPYETGDPDGERFVDSDGQLHERAGTATGDVWFGVPPGWAPPVRGYGGQVDGVLAQMRGERGQDLSETEERIPSRGAMRDFREGIRRAEPGTDALGGELGWAEGVPTTASDLHGHALPGEFVGEESSSDKFPAGTERAKLGAGNTQWTTEYDPDQTDSVDQVTVGDGLLYDSEGNLLDGKFGYVVSPLDGSLYIFNQEEGHVSKDGGWIPLAGVVGASALVLEALKANEHVTYVHHSTPVSGGAVAGAGGITVTAGQIETIDNHSGHYKPEGEYLWQTVNWLQAQGVDVSKIDVKTLATERNPEIVLKGLLAKYGRGNSQVMAAKAQLKYQIPEEVEARRLAAAMPPGSPAALHYKAFGCAVLNVGHGGTYCMSCDNDLDL